MTSSYQYCFSSPKMKQTSYFELLTAKNLSRIGVTWDEIDRVEPFHHLPGTLYPETGVFSENHPAGGSFGVHIFLKDKRDAWVYVRVSHDLNIQKDHCDGSIHWNSDIIHIDPDRNRLPPYINMPWHGLPNSEFLDISIIDTLGAKNTYRINRQYR